MVFIQTNKLRSDNLVSTIGYTTTLGPLHSMRTWQPSFLWWFPAPQTESDTQITDEWEDVNYDEDLPRNRMVEHSEVNIEMETVSSFRPNLEHVDPHKNES